jgi:hypothetical protein
MICPQYEDSRRYSTPRYLDEIEDEGEREWHETMCEREDLAAIHAYEPDEPTEDEP